MLSTGIGSRRLKEIIHSLDTATLRDIDLAGARKRGSLCKGEGLFNKLRDYIFDEFSKRIDEIIAANADCEPSPLSKAIDAWWKLMVRSMQIKKVVMKNKSRKTCYAASRCSRRSIFCFKIPTINSFKLLSAILA